MRLYIKLTIKTEIIYKTDFSLEEGSISPTGQFKKSLDSFYVTDSPLSVTNIAQMAIFYIKLTSLNDFSIEEVPVSPTGHFK